MAKKWDELPVYEIGTEKGAKLYDDGMRTNQPQTMSDGAQIYRGNDGNMYANKNGTTMAVKNNYNPFTSGNFKFEYDNGYGKQAQNIAQQLSGMTYDSWKQNSGQYAALADRYAQQGKMAMQDTVGDVSARTGGLASSYATTAGNQAYNQYMQTLEDAAMALYGDEYNRKMQQFNMMQGLDDAAYGRAWDNVNFKYGLYQDEYQREQDALANARADAGLTGFYNGQRTLQGQIFDHNVDQDAFNNGLATADRTGYMPDGTMTWGAKYDQWKMDDSDDRKAYDRGRDAVADKKDDDEKKLDVAITAAIGGDTSLLRQMNPDLTDEQFDAYVAGLLPEDKSDGGGGGGMTFDYGTFSSIEDKGEAYAYLIANGYSASEAETMMGYWESGGDGTVVNTVTPSDTQGFIGGTESVQKSNYETVVEDCKNMYMTDGKDAVLAYLEDLRSAGALTETDYTALSSKYRAK